MVTNLFLLLGVLTFGLSNTSAEEKSGSLFSKASCDFALELLKVQSKADQGNVVLSPNSIGVLLAIVQQGAQGNTLTQLNNVLHMTSEESKNGFKTSLELLRKEKENVTLEWGNRAYVLPNYHLDENFKKVITENFGAEIEQLNFIIPSPQDAADKMNNWIREVTHNNIKDFISPGLLTDNLRMVLLNAIYFKGLWDVPFRKMLTITQKFESSPESSSEVPFMSQIERFLAGEDYKMKIKWVDLPYKDEKFSMLFVLPLEKHGLNQVMENINGDYLRKLIDDEGTRQVTLRIPKFKLGKKLSLNGVLSTMGLTDLFTTSSNLRGIASDDNLVVSQVLHEANVEIDEEGSVASAATGIFFGVTSFVPTDNLDFTADHPFLFFILDRANKVPLFAGKVVNPM